MRQTQPDLVILDVMLPDLDGFEVCRRLRSDGSRVPVLFLTARDDTDDRVRGLTLGGDDYLVKPFSLEELVARVHAILRRTNDQHNDSILRCEDLVMDDDAHRVVRAGQTVDLSPTEYNLLRFLLANQGRVMSKAQILDHVWQYDFGGHGGDRRDLHRVPPPQDRHRRTEADPDGARDRLRPARARLGTSRCRCAPASCSD